MRPPRADPWDEALARTALADELTVHIVEHALRGVVWQADAELAVLRGLGVTGDRPTAGLPREAALSDTLPNLWHVSERFGYATMDPRDFATLRRSMRKQAPEEAETDDEGIAFGDRQYSTIVPPVLRYVRDQARRMGTLEGRVTVFADLMRDRLRVPSPAR